MSDIYYKYKALQNTRCTIHSQYFANLSVLLLYTVACLYSIFVLYLVPTVASLHRIFPLIHLSFLENISGDSRAVIFITHYSACQAIDRRYYASMCVIHPTPTHNFVIHCCV